MVSKKKTTKKTVRSPHSSTGSSDGIESLPDIDPMDPSGPYSEPQPKRNDSFLEEFRVWMHSAKGWLYGLILIGITGPLFFGLGTMRSNNMEDWITNYFEGQSSNDTVAYSVGDFVRSNEELEVTAKAIRSMTFGSLSKLPDKNSDEYKQFKQEQYEIDLLARSAVDAGIFNDPIFQVYIQNAFRESIARGYVLHSLKDQLNERTYFLTNENRTQYEIFVKNLKSRISADQFKALNEPQLQALYFQANLSDVQDAIYLRRRLLLQNAEANYRKPSR